MVTLLGDDMIQRVIQALHSEDFRFEDDLEPQDFPTDPVERLTDTPGEQRDLPLGVEQGVAVPRMPPRREQRIARETLRESDIGSPGSFQAAQAVYAVRTDGEMTTGNFVRKMLAKEGLDYQWDSTGQPDPITGRKSFDCSGIIYRIMQNNGFTNFPRTSAAIYQHSKKIPLKRAIRTRGAILYRPGHIEISLGNGKTIGAGSEGTGVRISDASQFTHGGLLPELKIGKALQEASRSRLKKPGKRFGPFGADALNRLEGSAPLISAATVFGSVVGEVAKPPRTRREFEANQKTGGLGFVPAKYRSIFAKAADRFGVSARLLAYVAQKESGFNPKAVSSAGAQGIMQIMPLHNLEDPFNARASIMFGAQLLAGYIDQMGSLRKGLAAYNAGPSNYQAGLGYADDILDVFLGRS